MNSAKIAVIGFGLIGKKHASIIQSHKELELCGIVENNKELINEKDFKCKFFSSIEEIFKTENLNENLEKLDLNAKENPLVNEVIEFINKDKKRPICTPNLR